MSERPNYCTCHMDGSFITSCPTHGKRMTLVRQAEQKVRSMTQQQLRSFLAPSGEVGNQK